MQKDKLQYGDRERTETEQYLLWRELGGHHHTESLSATIKCKSTGPRVTWDDRKKVKIIHTRIYNTSPAWVCVYYVYDDGDIADYRNREHMLLTSDQLNPLERFFTTFIMYKDALYERWITLKIKKIYRVFTSGRREV